MRVILSLCIASLACGATASLTALGREIVVSPNLEGDAVLAAAIRSAADGDSLRIQKGVYRETIVLDKRLQLVGEEGATIDPSQPLDVRWKEATDVGQGVYRAAMDRKPRALMIDGKLIAEIDERRANKKGDWSWKSLLATGTPLSKFRYIRACWMYRAAEKAAYLHVADDVDPARLTLSALWTSDAVVTFRGVKDTSIRGLTIAHGYNAIAVLGKSSRCTITDCTIGPWDKNGIFLSEGASECLIEKNRIFRGAYEDWTPESNSKQRYEVWQIHKNVGFYDRVGVCLFRAGENNRVRANRIWETFDGIIVGDWDIESLDIPLRSPNDGKGTEICDNVIQRTRDSGIELGGGCIDVRVHHNRLEQTHGGVRFKLPRIGPVFIYRNLLLDGTPFNVWFSMDDSPAEGYVYHNTIVGGNAGIIYNKFNKGGHKIGAPHWNFLNNILVAKKGLFEDWNRTAPVNFTADYNLVAGEHKPLPGATGKSDHSIFVKSLSLAEDHRPAADSPAIDAGLDLSTAYHGKPLPGCEAGYFQGKGPDIGAVEVK